MSCTQAIVRSPSPLRLPSPLPNPTAAVEAENVSSRKALANLNKPASGEPEAGLFRSRLSCQDLVKNQGWDGGGRREQVFVLAAELGTELLPLPILCLAVGVEGKRLGRGREDGGGWEEPSRTEDEDPDVYDGQDFSCEWCTGGRVCGQVRHFFNKAVSGVQ